jgi:multidrug resistance efflux pump
MATANENVGQAQTPKKSKVFLIILIALVVAGVWFGISKWHHAQLHAETDDAQIEANISPIIPRISGYVKEVRVSDNQVVKKGDTLLILDDRDMRMKVEQAEAALATAETTCLRQKLRQLLLIRISVPVRMPHSPLTRRLKKPKWRSGRVLRNLTVMPT